MDQLYQYILAYDILGLRDYWDYLNDRFFKRLDYQHYSNVKKLEMCLLRLYIVHALQNSKHDKVVEFFEKYTAELQTQTEWREWFGMSFSWCLNIFSDKFASFLTIYPRGNCSISFTCIIGITKLIGVFLNVLAAVFLKDMIL